MISDQMREIVTVFENVPYHQYLGFTVTDCADGFSRLQVTVHENILNPVGTLHGGVIYSLCAIASSLAALSSLSEGQYTVANDFNVSVLRPLNSGLVTVEARIIKSGKRLIFIGINVNDESGALAATARVTKTVLGSVGAQ